jgi:two-component system response regulator TctD
MPGEALNPDAPLAAPVAPLRHNAGMRILLVEDEPEMAAWLVRALKQSGFLIDVAATAREADSCLSAEADYDAVVLDLGLPDRSGMTVLTTLRDRGGQVPVLVLTAQGALPNRVRSLNQGADDFLAKPFALEELEARLWALMRRSQGRQHPRLQCGSLMFDSESRAFTLGGTLLPLTPREHAALLALLMRAGRPVGKAQLAGKVFPRDSNVGPEAIEQVLHRVRRKLGEAADVTVTTVRGLGYMLEPATGHASE